jgi:indole-3-glycerol phosphate synthase
MATHLDKILAQTRNTIAGQKELVPLAALERRAFEHSPRGFVRSLKEAAARGPAILAELKKASPSKGLIRHDFEVVPLAQALEAGGAAALSVLTDEPFFQGSLRNLEKASAATHLPCLRKDFIIDEYQIVEARAHRADAILLIVAALTDAELKTFTKAAHRERLDVLCEVHSEEELNRVLDLDVDAVGVNNRNLRTFEVSLETSFALAGRLPKDKLHVAESGLHSGLDLIRLREVGFDAFLIGESLMRQPDPGAALQALISETTSTKV